MNKLELFQKIKNKDNEVAYLYKKNARKTSFKLDV
tara:strand:+ start:356 stop:460 length:105 start_codon:yes stop_codon:yes gene_type:complete